MTYQMNEWRALSNNIVNSWVSNITGNLTERIDICWQMFFVIQMCIYVM